MCNGRAGLLQYSSEALRNIGTQCTAAPKRDVRKILFSRRIWSRRSAHSAPEKDVAAAKPRVQPEVKLGVMNARSVGNKLDYVFDHIVDNNLDIVALTETWLSNEEVNNRRVVMACSDHGYTLHHVPRSCGRTGGGVGVLINNRVKMSTRLESVNNAISFESMEMVITIVSICIRLVVIYRMPPSKKNKLKRGTFITEFSDYVEKLSCLSGNLIIVGDFNINWLDNSDSERRSLLHILETFGLFQHIDLPTYQNGHLLDYIITREASDFAHSFMVSDKISDHMALHASLTCQRPHPERKEIYVRALRRINNDALEADLAGMDIDMDCNDVNVLVTQYDTFLSDLLDKHAPRKRIFIVDRPLSDWMTDDILALKIIRRKNEVICRKNPLSVYFERKLHGSKNCHY